MDLEKRTEIPNSLEEHWMPFTSNRDYKNSPRLITEAKGVYLKTHHGKTQIDASSGLFCNPLGHGRKEITEAVTKQLETLDYAQPFQQGFGGSFELATKISKHTPGDLNKMFFTICGSTAVETAIKIAVAYHRAKGNAHRFRFVGRERGYHGMNIGCVSVGGMINNVKTFASILMPGVQHMRHTHLPEHKFVSGQPETGGDLADDLERIASNFGPENIAACIVEPIAGSTGTLVPPKGYLQRLREICDKHGILLIFDEVITGWGRTGSAFASHEFGVTPDIMTMAKATTNGVVPMGVVACKDEIYDAEYDRRFDLSESSIEKLMIISHAGTMSVLLSYFLNMPLYAWTWRKFLPRHTGHTTLKSTQISGGHFFRLKEFNNVSFTDSDEEQTY